MIFLITAMFSLIFTFNVDMEAFPKNIKKFIKENSTDSIHFNPKNNEKFSSDYDFLKLIKNVFGEKYDKEKIYILAIQGYSTSGKSTAIKNFLEKYDDKFEVIHCDNYLLHKVAGTDSPKIFDSPDCYNFDKMLEKLNTSILQNKKLTNKKIIIIEGIYAFNLINNKSFEFGKFDKTAESTEQWNLNPMPLIYNRLWLSKEENGYGFNKTDIKIFKLFMWTFRDLIIERRLERGKIHYTPEIIRFNLNNSVFACIEKVANRTTEDINLRICVTDFKESRDILINKFFEIFAKYFNIKKKFIE